MKLPAPACNAEFHQISISPLLKSDRIFVVFSSSSSKQNQYNMRRPHLIRSRAYTNYGTRMLSNLMPKLIEEICGDFLDENNRRIAKIKIKEKLVEVNRRNN
jgi:hypothetical protein